MKKLLFILLVLLPSVCLAQARTELGYQTTKRGIVWYRSAPPTHAPVWRLSQDTNAVMWVDRSTGLEYDWDYSSTRWRTYGTFATSTPPLPTETSGLATLDNRSATWRSEANISHYYDYTATAWVPIGHFFVTATAPANVTATISQGAAKYTTSLWQDSDDFQVYYWNGTSWIPFLTSGGPAGGDLSGFYPDPTVVGIQEVPVSAITPLVGQVFQYSGTEWVPSWGSSYVYVTATGTITSAVNTVLIGTLAGAATFGLPTCNAVNDGKTFQFQKGGTDSFPVTIDPNASEQFRGSASVKVIYSIGTGFLCTCRFSGGTGEWFFVNM